MKRFAVLFAVFAVGFVVAQTARDRYEDVLVSRFLGQWNGHLHFDKTPDEMPNDYFGTAEAKWTMGPHVEALVKVDSPKGARPFLARGFLGSQDALNVDASPYHSLNCVFVWDGDEGFLPMNGVVDKGRLIMEGDRVPKNPYGKMRVRVEFKSRDEIKVWLLDPEPTAKDPDKAFGYIDLTRKK